MELLQRIPKEHYTTHEGKQIKVGELLAILNEKNTSNGPSRRGQDNPINGTGKASKCSSLQRGRNKKRNK